jgi:hypothetical protein
MEKIEGAKNNVVGPRLNSASQGLKVGGTTVALDDGLAITIADLQGGEAADDAWITVALLCIAGEDPPCLLDQEERAIYIVFDFMNRACPRAVDRPRTEGVAR